MTARLSLRRLEIPILLFLSCLGCIDIPKEENLPPSVADHLCVADTQPRSDSAEYVTPTRRLSEAEIPVLHDDLDLADMDLVLERQLARFANEKLIGFIVMGEDRFPVRQVRDSLKAFQTLVRRTRLCLVTSPTKERAHCFDEFARDVKAKFAFYKPHLVEGDPRVGEEQPVMYTGYYTPRLEVSLKKEGQFQYPIYMKPNDEWINRMGRYEIDFKDGLAGRGLELFYAQSRFDLYLLHLEGGGRVFFQDEQGREQSKYISYGGSNGRKWRFIVAQMLNENWITEPTVSYQREFVTQNPGLEPEIFSYCPSYVFFKPTNHPPEGNRQVPLTDNRSIATDINYYRFKGVLAFVKTERPRAMEKDVEMMPFSRFVLDQDTGSAIRGKARVDFYLGEGPYAELAANTMKQRGDIYFMMLKP